MENDKKENGVEVDEKCQMKRYYIDFYDMFDGWGEFGFFTERLFDELDDATKLCDKLNEGLDKGNKMCGEHYGVIDGTINREVYCGQDKEYKEKIFGLDEQLLKSDIQKVARQCKKIGGQERSECNNVYKEISAEIMCLMMEDMSNSTGFDATQIENILRKRLGTHFPVESDQKTGKDVVGIKIPGTNFDLRINSPPEKIEMFAHSADCRYCNGVVKMMRDLETFKLQPDNCSCVMCGQRYFVEISGTIEEWELKQWRQKGQTFAMGGD